MAFALDDTTAGARTAPAIGPVDGLAGCSSMGVGTGAGATRGASAAPHILQKFIPGGFTVEQAGQVEDSRPGIAMGFGLGAGASSFCPQS